MKGSYTLLIELKKDQDIQIGKLGKISFKKGCYVYVGSALNGLEQRINRHLRKSKKMYWHIDYLLQHAKVIDVFCKESNTKEECMIVKSLDEKLSSIHGFGCSDCSCSSHLFHGFKDDISSVIFELNMCRYLF